MKKAQTENQKKLLNKIFQLDQSDLDFEVDV